APSTLQIGEGAVIAEVTGLPVICDFRVADVAAGGHGAPLIPLVDTLLFRHEHETRVLLNLGGIANLTVLPPAGGELMAFDTGPANMAMDAVARAASNGHESFDRDGVLARSGEVDQALLARLMDHPYFARKPPKSTGREMFGRDFVYPLLDQYGDRLADLAATLAALTVAATLAALTVQSIAVALQRFMLPDYPVARVYVSGGGVHNPLLMEGLAEALSPMPVASLAVTGIDPDAKEALGFAVLANETLFCHPGNIPTATGARGPRILGKIVLPTWVERA
ncbi:MAG: anhydro-N-acetylmuramic acid kinase, partial [Deltaproteobacteria bacterium]|nr:anhydro-N-acetylmuramic acid kinase [Deltaproteobacteria bacterium]